MKNKTNKLVSSGFIIVNGLGMLVTKDATMFVMAVVFGVPAFFSKDKLFM